MKTSLENGTLTLSLSGRIDTSNAQQWEEQINKACAENTHHALILDFDEVEYISSAGLRVLLRLKKSGENLCLQNVSSDVYEILDMTGFAEMLPVSKAYRKLSVDGCEVIGEGSNGIVYRYTDDIIIKVYKNNDALESIKRERELAKKSLVLGVNTAIPYDVVKVGDKYGSVFELLNSKSLSKWILSDPDHLEKYVQIFADLLKEIHATVVSDGSLPSIKKTYLDYADFLKDHLDKASADKLYHLIDAVPESNHMIHGDYHTNNVHYANNEAILIDMDTLAVGDPLFEFASIFLAYRGFNELDPHSSEHFLKINSDLCLKIYGMLLHMYFGGDDAEINGHDDSIRILGYTRLLRRTIRRNPDHLNDIQYLKENLTMLIHRTEVLR